MRKGQKNFDSSKRRSRRQQDPQSLHFLGGKEVQINRGGPESKTGILMSAQKDFVTVYADEAIYYYPTRHIHSITENIKELAGGDNTDNGEEISYHEARNLGELTEKLKNKNVQINNGPESKTGTLLFSNHDMLVILNEDDGNIYYNMEHIKSIAEITNDNEDTEQEEQDELQYEYDGPTSFASIFDEFKHKWISVNRKGPEAVEGVLIESNGGFYTVVNNEEAYRIHPHHIKTISEGPKGAFKQNQESTEEEEKQEGSREGQHESSLSESPSYENRSSSDQRSVDRRRSSYENRSSRRSRYDIKTIDIYH